MIEARRIVVGVVLATSGLIVLLGVNAISRGTVLAGYAIVLASIALAAVMRVMRAARSHAPSRFVHELTRQSEPPSRPNELIRVSRDLTLGMSNAGHYHSRLRPLFARIASARSTSPASALSAQTWRLVRPDAPEPEDLYSSGISLSALRTVLDELESL